MKIRLAGCVSRPSVCQEGSFFFFSFSRCFDHVSPISSRLTSDHQRRSQFYFEVKLRQGRDNWRFRES